MKTIFLFTLLMATPLLAQNPAPKEQPLPQKPATTKESDTRPCSVNFKEEGSFWTGKKFSSFQDIPKVTKAKAFDNVVQQVALDGWQVVSTNKDAGLVSASQSVGRHTVSFSIIIKDLQPDGIHIQATIKLGGGDIASDAETRGEFCKIFEVAAH